LSLILFCIFSLVFLLHSSSSLLALYES
jgi:hypothetical protein